jgi:adenylate kinase
MKNLNMEKETYHVIYLTGPPATGKSSLVEYIKNNSAGFEAFTYSEVLARYVGGQSNEQYSQRDMREMSANVITPETIEIVDGLLLDFVSANSDRRHVIIDSHAVTKEEYGFRVTPFSTEKLESLRPTLIFVLYSEPSVVIDRIKNNPMGRPSVSEFEAGFHCALQANVALIYGLQLGIPVYFLDAAAPTEKLAQEIIRRTGELRARR